MVARKRVKLNPGNPIDFTEFYRGAEAEGKYPEWPEGLRHVAFFPRESVESLYENVFDRRFRHAYYADRRIIRRITDDELLGQYGQPLFSDVEVRSIWRFRWMLNAGHHALDLIEPLSAIWLFHREILYIPMEHQAENVDAA